MWQLQTLTAPTTGRWEPTTRGLQLQWMPCAGSVTGTLQFLFCGGLRPQSMRVSTRRRASFMELRGEIAMHRSASLSVRAACANVLAAELLQRLSSARSSGIYQNWAANLIC